MSDTFRLIRERSTAIGTRGVLLDAAGELLCYTLELPWKENQRRVSCIPKGTYGVVKHSSEKYKDVWRLLDVPQRDGILIHAGNTIGDIQGCILVGMKTYREGVLESRNAIQKLRTVFPETFVLEII